MPDIRIFTSDARTVQFADMSQEFGYTKVPQPVTTEAQPLQEDLP
jgi:hypothetical protein